MGDGTERADGSNRANRAERVNRAERPRGGTAAARSGLGPARRAATSTTRPGAGSSRGATRPAASSRGRRQEAEPHPARTVRLAVLATIVVVLSITLVPAVRSFLGQQGQIDAVRTALVQQRRAVAGLQQEQLKWNDPAYVEQQARERLTFVKVGEKPYTVLDAPPAGASGGVSLTPLASTAGPTRAWYARLWASVAAPDPYVSAGVGGDVAK